VTVSVAHIAAVALYQDAGEDVTGYAMSKQSDAFTEEEGEQEHLLVEVRAARAGPGRHLCSFPGYLKWR